MLSAPWIRSPLAAGGTRVFIDGCVPSGTTVVRLSVNGVPQPDLPADNETVLVLTSPLSAGDRLSVVQGDTVGISVPSAELVVQAMPSPLTPPVFQTLLYTTSRGALMTHLVPGAVVTLSAGGIVIGQATCDNDSLMVPFSSPNLPLPTDSTVVARMTYAGQTSILVSSQGIVEPSPLAAPRTPAPPVLGPAYESARAITVAESYPGATVTLERDGKQFDYLMPGPSANLIVDRINAGVVIGATQRFEVQEWNRSSGVKVQAQPLTPPPPGVTGAICPAEDCDVLVEGIGGALVQLRATGSDQNLLTGIIDPATGRCRLRVPAGIGGGASSMDVIQQLCSRSSPASSLPILAGPPQLPGQPHFPTNLYGCGRVIAVSGLTVDTTLTIMSQQLGPIGSTLVTTPNQEIPVSPLLVEGDVITLQVHACGGEFGGQVQAPVQPRPEPELTFSQDSFYEGDTQVLVKGITPGSRVDLFVGDALVSSLDVATGTHLFAIPALKVGDLLRAQQIECRGPADQAARSNPVQAVRQLELTLDTAQGDSMYYATKGLTAVVQATVTDAATHAPVAVGVSIPDFGSIPSNWPTPVIVPLSGGTTLQCATDPLPGYQQATGYLQVRPLFHVANTQPVLVVVSSRLVVTFDDDQNQAQHPVPDLLQGPLTGVPRRKQSVKMTLVGSVDYHLADSTLQHLTADTGPDTTLPVGPKNQTLTVFVNTASAKPDVDFRATD